MSTKFKKKKNVLEDQHNYFILFKSEASQQEVCRLGKRKFPTKKALSQVRRKTNLMHVIASKNIKRPAKALWYMWPVYGNGVPSWTAVSIFSQHKDNICVRQSYWQTQSFYDSFLFNLCSLFGDETLDIQSSICTTSFHYQYEEEHRGQDNKTVTTFLSECWN